MHILDLPVELIDGIAEQTALQSGLDLLSLSRTCSTLRRAARRAGRADLARYAKGLDGDIVGPSRKDPPSPLLQSCITHMPALDFPVAVWDRWPDGMGPRTVLLGTFEHDPEDRRYLPHDLESSLFLRQIHEQTVELWDVQGHAPHKVELPFARPIIRATVWARAGDDAEEEEEDGGGDGGGEVADWDLPPCSTERKARVKFYPCLYLQTITLGQTRVVLAQTFSERTFHLIDEHGQPYLTHNISIAPLPEAGAPSVTPTEQERIHEDERDADGAHYLPLLEPPAVESMHRRCIPSPSGCGKEACRALCRIPQFEDLRHHEWSAVRLPRLRPDDAEPGILFYHLRQYECIMDWALLRARPDRDSSETIISGEIDLAWLSDMSVQVLPPPSEGEDYLVQMHWTETGGAGTESFFVRLAHFPLGALSSLAPSTPSAAEAESSRSRVALARFERRPGWDSGAHSCFHFSRDGLALYALMPTPGVDSATLSLYERASVHEPWPAEPKWAKAARWYRRIVAAYDDWLVLGDDKKGSVRVLRMSTRSSNWRKYRLLEKGFDEWLKPHRTGPLGRYSPPTLSFLAGRVVATSPEGLVSGILDLTAEDEPVVVDLAQLVRRRRYAHRLQMMASESGLPPGIDPSVLEYDTEYSDSDSDSDSDDYDESDESDDCDLGCCREAADGRGEEYAVFCHGAVGPNAKEYRLCVGYSDEEARRKPLLLFLCARREIQRHFPTRPQFVVALPPGRSHEGAAGEQSVRCEPDELEACCTAAPLVQLIASGGQVLLEPAGSGSSTALLELPSARVHVPEAEKLAIVFGRWTNQNAPSLLLRSPYPVDGDDAGRRWFTLRAARQRAGAGHEQTPGSGSGSGVSRDECSSGLLEWDESYDPGDYRDYGDNYDDDASIRWAGPRRLQREIRRTLHEDTRPRGFIPGAGAGLRGGQCTRPRLVPNWLLDGPHPVFVAAAYRLLAFLTRPDTHS